MKKKILLPNGCYCSQPRISPLSAYGKKASTDKDWSIQYRFYDPADVDDKKNIIPHQVVFKGMNEFKNVLDRRIVSKQLIENALQNLQNGYNPRNRAFDNLSANGEIHPTANFIRACEMATEKLKCSEQTKKDVRSCLTYIEKSAVYLKLQNLQVQEVRRKHISNILDNCRHVKDYWSSQLFNHYRAYMMMVFKQLVKDEALESNPVDENLPKEKVTKKLKKLPTDEQVKAILNHFKEDHYFTRFFHIFFHSGDREVDFTRIRYEDVNMEEGIYKKLDLKGHNPEEKEKDIKFIALKYWKELMAEAKPGQYLFGTGFRPSNKPTTRDYITKYWQRKVKHPETGLGINVGLYDFKYKNLDEISKQFTLETAREAAAHKSVVVTMGYAVGEKKRESMRYAAATNELGG